MIIVFNDYRFAKNIRYLRERRGMTREELAMGSGMDPDILTALEEERLLELEGRAFAGVCRALGEKTEDIAHEDLT